ncbi:unnamed protein product [Diamesa serratosioi]
MDHNIVKPQHRGPLTMAVRSTREEFKTMQMKIHNCEKDYRERELFHLKEEPMPIIQHKMPRFIEYKCRRCNVDNLTYTNANNWYLEPVDALAREPAKINWFDQLISFVNRFSKNKDITEILINTLARELPQFIRVLVVHPAQIRMLQKLQKTQPNIPIVYVLSTDNAIDVIALNFILMKNQLKTALIMADGEMVSVAGMEKLAEYVNDICLKKDELTENRVLDCFQVVENIAVVLNKENDNVLDKILKASGYGLYTEIYLITVSINHEISNINLSRNTSNCGMIRCSFNEPYLVKDLTRDCDDDSKLTKRVSQHLKFDLILRRPIMCTNVVAFLLLYQFRNGTSVKELAAAVVKFCEDNVKLDYNFQWDFEAIVNHAVNLYGKDVIMLQDDVIKINETFGSLVYLYEYAKVMLPHFMINAIVVTSADYHKRIDKVVDYFKVLKTAEELSYLMNIEFLLIKPCEEIKTSLNAALDTLLLMELITKPEIEYTEDEMQARKIAKYFEDSCGSDDDSYDGAQHYYVSNKEDEMFINEEKNEEWNQLLDLLKPILWNYLTVAKCLIELIDSEPIPENDFIENCHQQLIGKYESGKCKYGESVSKDSMMKYLKFLEQQKVFDIGFEDEDVEKKTRKIWLTNKFNEKKEIEFLIQDVEMFLI